MKFKDIEKKLKREQEQKTIPDVYARVSQSPLNKLLLGETPARAFQKRAVMSLLLIVLVLFLGVAIGLSAMWLSPADTKGAPDCYVAVTVNSEAGDMRLGLVMSGGRSIVKCVVEENNGAFNKQPIVSYKSRISDFISPKSGDKVSISILSTNSALIADCARFISNELETVYNGVSFTMSTDADSAHIRADLTEYILACGGSAADGADNKTLIQAYADLFV